jgi:hypothetical protein
MMPPVRLWCRVSVVGPGGGIVASWVLERSGHPDLGTVDDLARLALVARRLGGGVVLGDLCPCLRQLLELVGLPDHGGAGGDARLGLHREAGDG